MRLRRLRGQPALRRLVARSRIDPSQLVLPLFVRHDSPRRPIASLPGHDQLSLSDLEEEARLALDLGLGGVILFGIPGHKDATGSDATSDRGIVARSIAALKNAAPDLLVITDVCCCEYTDHGHCGIVRTRGASREVDNDATLELLARQAVVHATAGADVVAPSGMMDGMVSAIRRGLDAAGYEQTPILSYAAKYASAFYGPFREAAESAPQFGDRRSYQMDPQADAAQALREIQLDLQEGADMIMVKPALAYLDIVRLAADRFPGVPLAAYNVSGEYSMIKAAAERGWVDERSAALESLVAIHRAGAGIIVTYWAKQVAQWIQSK
jgi:porphobilinogen synthase